MHFRCKKIQTKWVNNNQLNNTGKRLRQKARLVSKDFRIYRMVFFEVFSAVSKYGKIILMFSVSVVFKWKHILVDVKNAFVNFVRTEEIFIVQPEGFIVNGKKSSYIV